MSSVSPKPFPLLLALLTLAPTGASAGRAVHNFRTFTVRDGLAHNIVRDVLEASDRSIWFATMGGVTRYDPRQCSYRTFASGGSLPRQEVMSLARGRDGTIWVATQGGGIAAFSRDTWTWYTVKDGLPSDEITSLMVDRSGRLWATPTNGGIAMYDGHRWRAFSEKDGLSPGEIGRCASLRDGSVVCGTYGRPVLQRFKDGRWSQVAIAVRWGGGGEQGRDAPARRHFYVHALTETREGELWLATKGAGAIRGATSPRGDYRWTVYDRSAGLASNRVGAIHQAGDGALWFATAAGVSRFDGEQWKTFSASDGLGANQVFAITETDDGALWFATLGGGASRYAPSGWERITEEDGLSSDSITGGLLAARGGSLWAGTDRGPSVLKPGAQRWQKETSPGAPVHINHIIQDKIRRIWVATRDGVKMLEGGSWTHFPADPAGVKGPRHAVVRRLALDTAGRLWAATASGVSMRGPDGSWRGFSRRDGLPSNRIYDVVVHPSGVWVATENGVARLEKGGRWTPFLSPEPASRTNRIYSLAIDGDGTLWASGLEGVAQLVRKRPSRKGGVSFGGETWSRAPPNAWLPAGIYSRFVMSTADGSLWFGVRGLGVRRLAPRGRWTAYPPMGGDALRDVLSLPDGSFLFATLGSGLTRLTPDRDPPQTFIGSTGRGKGAPRTVIRGEDLVLAFSGQDVLKHTRTRDLLYSYRVDGGAWSSFSHGTRAWLADLAPGRHVFEVRAMDQDLNVDPTPAKHTFRVLRPWWAQPSLIAVVICSLLLVVYALFRIGRAMARERAAVVQEQAALAQRRQFVRLASHELRKPLTRLAHRAELLTLPATLEDKGRLEEHAQALVRDSGHVSRLVETLLEQARIQEGLELKLEPGDLSRVAGAVVEEYAEDDVAPELKPTTTALPVRYDPFYLPLAIRNLVDNAIKYGGQGVTVETVRRDGQAVLVVRDQGPGIPEEDRQRVFEPFFRGKTRPEHGGFGLGLSFAREITKAHAGALTLEPTEAGAAFSLSLPLFEVDRGGAGAGSTAPSTPK
jgi:signal transduction histidine kinase/ligand-binding sensor domain-containing protein